MDSNNTHGFQFMLILDREPVEADDLIEHTMPNVLAIEVGEQIIAHMDVRAKNIVEAVALAVADMERLDLKVLDVQHPEKGTNDG